MIKNSDIALKSGSVILNNLYFLVPLFALVLSAMAVVFVAFTMTKNGCNDVFHDTSVNTNDMKIAAISISSIILFFWFIIALVQAFSLFSNEAQDPKNIPPPINSVDATGKILFLLFLIGGAIFLIYYIEKNVRNDGCRGEIQFDNTLVDFVRSANAIVIFAGVISIVFTLLNTKPGRKFTG